MAGYTDPGKEVYDALLDQYEEGMDSATMDRLFEELKAALIPLVQKILAAKQPDDTKFHAYFDPDDQRKVQDLLLSYIGFSRRCRCSRRDRASFYTEFFFQGCPGDKSLL